MQRMPQENEKAARLEVLLPTPVHSSTARRVARLKAAQREEVARESLKDLRHHLGGELEQRVLSAFVRPGYSRPSWWIGIVDADQADDDSGVDAIVGTRDAGEILVQIKRSQYIAQKFREQYANKPRFLRRCAIVVVKTRRPWAIRQVVFRAVREVRARLLPKSIPKSTVPVS